MTLRRPAVLDFLRSALQGLEIDGSPMFPAPITIDAEELSGWRQLDGGLQDAANISGGKFSPTIQSGPENEWEGERDCEFAYGVTGADRDARVARRDAALPLIIALLQADRTLASGDPQVFAEIGDTTEDDDAVVPDAGAVSLARITINILYVADSAAG